MSDDERDANRTALRIERYWRDLGYPSVVCSVETMTGLDTKPAHVVRCNLVNGLPIDFRSEDLLKIGRTG